jgi:hypothetical protein
MLLQEYFDANTDGVIDVSEETLDQSKFSQVFARLPAAIQVCSCCFSVFSVAGVFVDVPTPSPFV